MYELVYSCLDERLYTKHDNTHHRIITINKEIFDRALVSDKYHIITKEDGRVLEWKKNREMLLEAVDKKTIEVKEKLKKTDGFIYQEHVLRSEIEELARNKKQIIEKTVSER